MIVSPNKSLSHVGNCNANTRENIDIQESGNMVTKLTGAKRREWMGMGVAGMIIDSYCGSFPHSLLSTSKTNMENNDTYPLVINHGLLENRSSGSMIFPANTTSISTGVLLKPRLFHSNK